MTESDRREHRYRLLAILVGLLVVTAADVALTVHGSSASLQAAQRFDGASVVLLAALADAVRVLAKHARQRADDGRSRGDDDDESEARADRLSAAPPDPGARARARADQRGRARDAAAEVDAEPAQDARHASEHDDG